MGCPRRSPKEAGMRELEDLRSKEAETRDQLLRARAELENLRKRTARDVENARKFALQNFVRELLPVKDSLETGLRTGSIETSGSAASLMQGIRLTLKLWQEALAREGVEELDPLGQPFDPDLHEALTTPPLARRTTEDRSGGHSGRDRRRYARLDLGGDRLKPRLD